MTRQENKEKYMKEIDASPSAIEGCKMIFKKIKPLENELDKDLKDFDYSELLRVLELLKGRSYNSVHTKWGITKKYLKFHNNKAMIDITADDLRKQIIEQEVRYVTREELRSSLSIVSSATHKLMLFLMFDGVTGKGYKDLLHLQYENIDFEKSEVNINGNNYELSEDSLELLKKVKEETSVVKLLEKNGVPFFDDTYDLNMSSPYVFKTRIVKATDYGRNPYKVAGMQRRMDILTKMIGLSEVSGKSLYYSGLIERYLKLEKRIGRQLSITDIELFKKMVGATTIQANTMYRALQLYRN